MKFADLKQLYLEKKRQFGEDAYQHVSDLLREAKELHKVDWLKNPTPGSDHEQSWRAFKGKNLEKLIEFMIKDEVESLGLKVVKGDSLEKTSEANLSEELRQVKRNLTIDYGEFGSHFPDADLIIYDPHSSKVLAVLSSKVTSREKIAHTGYWKRKFLEVKTTEHIQVYLITLDEDGDFNQRIQTSKGRAIAEVDLNGGYVLTQSSIEESDKVKLFPHLIEDLKALRDAVRGNDRR